MDKLINQALIFINNGDQDQALKLLNEIIEIDN